MLRYYHMSLGRLLYEYRTLEITEHIFRFYVRPYFLCMKIDVQLHFINNYYYDVRAYYY